MAKPNSVARSAGTLQPSTGNVGRHFVLSGVVVSKLISSAKDHRTANTRAPELTDTSPGIVLKRARTHAETFRELRLRKK